MQKVVMRAGALVLSVSALGLLVSHAALSGCRADPPEVVVPSADPPATSRTPVSEAGNIASPGGATEAKGDSDSPATKSDTAKGDAAKGDAAKHAPAFMGASKAAPVMRGDEVRDLENQQAKTPAPNPPPQKGGNTTPKPQPQISQ